MPNKRSYLFKSLLFVFAILVLVSNIQGLLQQDRQQKLPTLTVDSDNLFHEYLTLESNPIVVDDTTLSTATLIISFGLTDQLHSRLWQYYTADTLVNYVAYPLQGNIAEEVALRNALLTRIEHGKGPILFVAQQEWTHLALEVGSQITSNNLKLLLLNPTPLPDSHLLGGYYLNNLFVQAYGYTLQILYHALPHFGKLTHWKERAQDIRLVSAYQLSQATQHSFELAKISKIIRTQTNEDARWIMNENQRIPLMDTFVQRHSLFSDSTMYVLDTQSLARILPFELTKMAQISPQGSHRLPWESAIQEEFNLDNYVRVSGVYLAVLMLIIALISLFSEDLACISAGVLASRGVLHLSNAILASALGVIVFDVFIYVLGRTFKRVWLQKVPLRWMMTEKDLDYFTHWFSKNAVGVLWLSRFIPGSRFPAYFSAGLCKYPLPNFLLHFIASTLVWAPILAISAYLLGQEMMNYYESYYGYIPQLILGIGISLYLVFNWILPLSTSLGRRKIFRRWIRFKKLFIAN